MTRDEWLQQFEDELRNLRPHLTGKVAHTLALRAYNEEEHPRVAVSEYDKQQPTPAPAPAKKRAK